MTASLKMKDLEAETGVSREAIHFYLREGLLPAPEKPKRNVAFYSDEHVVRIRAIKRLQQDRSLSLEAIRELLDRFDYDSMATGDNLSQFELSVESLVNGDLPSPDEPLDQVAARTGLSVADLDALDEQGVIRIVGTGDERRLDYRDAGIVTSWAQVLHLGFGNHREYDASYVSRFADALKTIAAQEVTTFLELFGELPTGEASEMAARGINATNELIVRLRTQAIMRELHARADAEPASEGERG